MSSSSSTLWATASKEWVIQPKPKPGRKPKKDMVLTKPGNDTDTSDGRRIQNRAAQRAFRERKQSQLAELQARLHLYEQGEIERNVALQNIAKRLKEENEALRGENQRLKGKLSTFERSLEPSKTDRKRTRGDSPLCEIETLKKSKPCLDSSETHTSGLSHNPSPPSMISSPGSNDTSETLSYEGQANQSPILNLLQFPPADKLSHLDSNRFAPFDCGLCTEDTPCICRDFAAQQAQVDEPVADYRLPTTYGLLNASSDPISHALHTELISVPPCTSILEKLPAYQPAVPLRRRAVSSGNAVFSVIPQTAQQPSSPTCSGDPSNCMACADDVFGKAFCAAIKESVDKVPPCTCDQGQFASDRVSSSRATSCQNPSDCACRRSMPGSLVHPSRVLPETMPTNDAWRQLKLHPKFAFADLSSLADVVARRSTCGSGVVISPGFCSAMPESTISLTCKEFPPERDEPRTESNRESIPSRGSPRLVPQDVLIRCARQRVREVETDAVRAALRLLDAKFV